MKIIGTESGMQLALAPTLIALLFPALFLAVLRMDILDLRHQLAVSHQQETTLLEENDRLTVLLGEEHDVKRLQQVAAKRGFISPEHVIDLAHPQRLQSEE